MAYTNRLLYEPLRSIDSATFTGDYQAIGEPLANPCTLIKLINASNQLVTISVDGVTNHDVAPANSFWLYDITTNTPREEGSGIFVSQGTQYYVSGSAGTGLVYLVVQYVMRV